MNMRILNILCCFITLLTYSIWCREYEECRGLNVPNIVVASKKNCAKYIFCDGEDSYEGECLLGNYFNDNIGSCDVPKNVLCNIEPNDDAQSIYDEDFVTKENTEESIPEGNSDDADVFNNETKEIEKLESNSTDTAPQAYNSKCPQLNGYQNIKHVANPESCVAFYTCYNGNAISMLCPAKMYFNENSSKCEREMPESCKSKYTVRLKCRKGVYDFLPHPYRCEYYFYCLNGYLMIMRCPSDFTWHFVRGTCVQKSQSNCYSENSVISRKDE